jgi:hypothetical protein
MSIIPKVAKKPITKPKPEAKKPIIKPKQVAKKPIIKPKQVAKKPIIKPKQVAKKPIIKPKQVAKKPIIKPKQVAKKPIIKPKQVAKKPIIKPKPVAKKPIIKPKQVAKKPIIKPKQVGRGIQNLYQDGITESIQPVVTPQIPEKAISLKPLPKSSICSRILTPKQVGPICWFMAVFVAMFYSQRSRKILLEASKTWKTEKELFPLLKHVLDDKYLKTMTSSDYDKASEETFNEILKYLNKHDPLSFPYDPTIHTLGFYPEYFIGQLYKLLNVDYKVFFYNKWDKDSILFYSYLNMEFNSVVYETIEKYIENSLEKYVATSLNEDKSFIYKDHDMKAPKILMVIVSDNKNSAYVAESKLYEKIFPGTIIGDGDTKKNITSMNDKIFYRGSEYHLDSVILENWNSIELGEGHAIAGITCKGNKYVYNGWVRPSKVPAMANAEIRQDIPCELMRYDWDIKQEANFCLSRKNCKLVKKTIKSDLCYNFTKGNRILVYVRKDRKEDSISVTSKSPSNKSQDVDSDLDFMI